MARFTNPSRRPIEKGSPTRSRPAQAKPHAPRPPWGPIQLKAADKTPPTAVPNRTGLPDAVKLGVEAVSGLSMDDVRVHRNSDAPAALGAIAYAQGADIYLGPGQEKHLLHEAWHVVQQKEGRVAGTAERQGIRVNEDRSLEREADVMGSRAVAAAFQQPAGERALRRTSALPDAPVQMLTERSHNNQLWQDYEPLRLFNPNDWITQADRLEADIAVVRESLDEEAPENGEETRKSKAELDELEGSANKQVVLGNALMKEINGVGFTALLQSEKLKKITHELQYLQGGLHKKFWPSGSGFSAVSRARNDEKVALTPTTSNQNAPFFRSSKVGDYDLATIKVSGKEAQPQSKSNSLTLEDRVVDPGKTSPKDTKFTDKLEAPQGDGVSTSRFVAKARGGTQGQAMGGTNARAYAWVSGTDGWASQDWEWLHVRAASLGGATTPRNLVLGTRDANTHMMPFESNLIYLASIASENKALFEGLQAKWSFATPDNTWKHKVDHIRMQWSVELKPDVELDGLDSSSLSGDVYFYPLESKAVLTQIEVKGIETVLKAHREKIAAGRAAAKKKAKKEPEKKSNENAMEDVD